MEVTLLIFKKKRMIYDTYYNLLKNNKYLIVIKRNKNHTPWSFDLYSKKKKLIKKMLKQKKIFTRDVYPSLNSQKIYNKFKKLEVSNFFCKNGLWLPSSLNLKITDIKFICKIINSIT